MAMEPDDEGRAVDEAHRIFAETRESWATRGYPTRPAARRSIYSDGGEAFPLAMGALGITIGILGGILLDMSVLHDEQAKLLTIFGRTLLDGTIGGVVGGLTGIGFNKFLRRR